MILGSSSCVDESGKHKEILDSDVSYTCVTSYGSINSPQKMTVETESLNDKKKSTKPDHHPLSKATLRAMLSYSLPDWPWIVGGILFLVCASVSQVFLPLFIGKVVSGELKFFLRLF